MRVAPILNAAELLQTIDYVSLTYLLAPLVREIMGIERRSMPFDASMLTADFILDKLSVY